MRHLKDIGLPRPPSWAGLRTGCLRLHLEKQEAGALEGDGGGVLEPLPCI